MITIIAPSLDDKRIYRLTRLLPGTVQRAASVFRHASGKGANAARAAAALGGTVLLCAPVGPAMREIVERQLGAAGIRLSLVETLQPTRSCITVLEDDGRATELVQEAHSLEDEAADAFSQAALQACRAASVLLLAGSLPPGLPDDFYRRCASAAQAHGAAVLIDAQRAALLHALEAGGCIVKINREELGNTLGKEIPREDVGAGAQNLVNRGAAAVIVTDGAAPVTVRRADRPPDTVVPPSVVAVNPVGSGDSMSGALALGLQRGWLFDDALRFAVAASAANAASLLPGDVNPERAAALLGSMSTGKGERDEQ